MSVDLYNDSAMDAEAIKPLVASMVNYQPIIRTIRFWSDEEKPNSLFFYVDNGNGIWMEGEIDSVMLSAYEDRPTVWADGFGEQVLQTMLWINRH